MRAHSGDLGDCYRVLGLEQGAPMSAVKAAYRELVKVWHPDRYGDDARRRQEAHSRLTRINEAFERIQRAGPQQVAQSASAARAEASRRPVRAASDARAAAAQQRKQRVGSTLRHARAEAQAVAKQYRRELSPVGFSGAVGLAAALGALLAVGLTPIGWTHAAVVAMALAFAGALMVTLVLGGRLRGRPAALREQLRRHDLACPHCRADPVRSLLAAPRRLRRLAQTGRCPDCSRAYWLR